MNSPQWMPGAVRRLRRPVTDASPAFDLAYVRTGPRDLPPVVVIPGGPGLGSLLPYRRLRRIAAKGPTGSPGLDIIMIEHRGVGCSRRDVHGQVLPVSAMQIIDVIDDIAAVLEYEGVSAAFIAGSSYGSYLTSAFGARHPEKVLGMLLDSALQSASDIDLERRDIRSLCWDAPTALARDVRELVARGADQRILLDVVRAAYELGGEGLAGPLVRERLKHKRSLVWRGLEVYATRSTSIARFPGLYEFDPVGAIGFRELGYGGVPDGLPLDPALTYAPLVDHFPAFDGEPFDLAVEVAKFSWPMVLLAGSRDLRTPIDIARRVEQTAPDAVLVEIEGGHSALDHHPAAFLNAVRQLVRGQHERLPGEGARLSSLPKRGVAAARLPGLLSALLKLETVLLRLGQSCRPSRRLTRAGRARPRGPLHPPPTCP